MVIEPKPELPKDFYSRLFDAMSAMLLLEHEELKPDTAWRLLYSSILWLEDSGIPHIRESNDLKKGNPWFKRAQRAEQYLKQHLRSKPLAGLGDSLDWAMEERNRYRGSGSEQRQNLVGNAFEHLMSGLLRSLCQVSPVLKPALGDLRGFELAPKGYVSQPDLILFSPSEFEILVSTKWSLRKDRLGEFLYEARFYREPTG